MIRVRNLLGAALLGLTLTTSGALAATYVASLDGLQEVPPHASPASGTATAVLTGNTLSLSGSFSGLLGNFTASHIHNAPAGTNGGVVFPLTVVSGGTSGTFAATNVFVLTAAQLAALQAGNYYVNVHSQLWPGGEIRGQLLLAPEADAHEQPAAFQLEQNHPNPFNPTTTINLSMAETSRATLTVYNVLGQPVATLVDGMLERGEHAVLFNALDLPSGRYVYTLEAAGQRQSRGMLLIK
jgi:hypothetical protein